MRKLEVGLLNEFCAKDRSNGRSFFLKTKMKKKLYYLNGSYQIQFYFDLSQTFHFLSTEK